jgi:hypothetical protein
MSIVHCPIEAAKSHHFKQFEYLGDFEAIFENERVRALGRIVKRKKTRVKYLVTLSL